ncbi:hypothetical protein BC829DRAFT_395948 [Chytridium lagenaria]|nr:hypothetical protein BC829DRAFT_395948 [Chytridium lagenaria]
MDWQQQSPNDMDDGKLDVRSLLLSQPKTWKRNYDFIDSTFLEQSTKEIQPPQWSSSAEIKEAEMKNDEMKTKLKAYKRDLGSACERLAEVLETVVGAQSEVIAKRNEIEEEESQRLLEQFDPNEPTYEELQTIYTQQEGPLMRDRAEMADLEKQIEDMRRENESLKQNLVQVSVEMSEVDQQLEVEARKASLRDPDEEKYTLWCEQWSKTLMGLLGIQNITPKDSSCISIIYDLTGGRTCTLEITFKTPHNSQKYAVEGKLSDCPCNIYDIRNQNVQDATLIIVYETRRRITKYYALVDEVETLRAQLPQRNIRIDFDVDRRFGKVWFGEGWWDASCLDYYVTNGGNKDTQEMMTTLSMHKTSTITQLVVLCC